MLKKNINTLSPLNLFSLIKCHNVHWYTRLSPLKLYTKCKYLKFNDLTQKNENNRLWWNSTSMASPRSILNCCHSMSRLFFHFRFRSICAIIFQIVDRNDIKNDAVVQRKITNSNKKKYLNATWVKSDSVILLLLYFYAFLILMSCHVLHSKFLNFKLVELVCVFILLKNFKSTKCCHLMPIGHKSDFYQI